MHRAWESVGPIGSICFGLSRGFLLGIVATRMRVSVFLGTA